MNTPTETKLHFVDDLSSAKAALQMYKNQENECLNKIQDLHVKQRLVQEKIDSLELTIQQMSYSENPKSWFVRFTGR